MKNKYINILLGIGVFFTISSCDKYLEEVPDNRQVPKTADELAAMLVYAYNEETYYYIEAKTDNAVAIPGNEQIAWLTENYKWEPVVSAETQDTPTNFWFGAYRAIAQSNQVLEYLKEIRKKGDSERLKAVEGEALVTRAYNHFLLASIFCEIYDKNTASQKLGIPYVKKPEDRLITNYSRGTLEETYQNIKSDLEKGLPLLSAEFYSGSGKYHFTPEAGYAFASRFYLFMKDYDNCIKYSDKLLGVNSLDTKYIRDMKSLFVGSNWQVVAEKFSAPELSSNLLLERKNTGTTIFGSGQGYLSDTNTFIQVFVSNLQSGDARQESSYAAPPLALGRRTPKFNPLILQQTNTSALVYFSASTLRSEEVILNRMEAYVQKGMFDKVLSDYNLFAPYRYKGGGQLTEDKILDYYQKSKQESYLALVLDERRREFFGEGIRWWDIRRHQMEITHIDVLGNVTKLLPNDLRAVEQIPVPVIKRGIQPNPR